MAKPRTSQKKIATSSWERGLSLAWTAARTGSKWIGYKVKNATLYKNASDRPLDLGFLIEQAEILSKELGLLKGTAMKAGQMLAVAGESFFPPEVTQILRKLHSESPPLPWEVMQKTLRRRLKPEQLQQLDIDPISIGSASLGQVHRAVCKKSGKNIILKIQYPGVEDSVESDLKMIRRILSMTKLMPDPSGFDDLYKELKTVFKRETDYEWEAQQTKQYKALIADDSFFVVPGVIDEYSGKRILALSYEEGVSVESVCSDKMIPQSQKNFLAEKCMTLYFHEFFEWGVMQTDPHFGNYLVRLNSDKTEITHLILLDFGATRTFSKKFISDYRNFFWATLDQNKDQMLHAASELGFIKETDSKEHIDRIMVLAEGVLEPFTNTFAGENGEQIYDFSKTNIHKRLLSLGMETARQSAWRAPPSEIVFLHRKLGGVFAMLFRLEAQIATKKTLLPFRKERVL